MPKPGRRNALKLPYAGLAEEESNPGGVTTTGDGSTTFQGPSAVTYDYRKNIGGLVSFVVSETSDSNQFIGISYTESSLWITSDGSDATQNVGIDETLWFQIAGPGKYSVQPLHDRGGFRYLNIYHNTTGNVTLSDLATYYTAMPHFADDAIGNYTGYFHSNNEKLNRVWYAAAYTDQLCTIPSTSGNSLVDLTASDENVPTYWWSNSTLTNGTSALVDGAKRDKLIWPGDYSISVPGVFLSTNDAYTVKLSIEQLYRNQNATTGALPYFASPIITVPESAFISSVNDVFSFTYHLYSILGLNNYWIYTGDIEYLEENWARVKHALNYSLSFVDETGLANVTSSADWLRVGMGGHNIEANSVLRYTLETVLTFAHALNDTSVIESYSNYSAGIVDAANTLLWDSSSGLYKDNETTTLHPQDGNCWAIISGVANTSQATAISTSLAARWGPYGAPAPEAGTTVSPFITGFELQAHFLAGHPQYAIDLMQFMWFDFMLDDPRMTNSTFNEGYDVSGALHYPAYEDDARISHAHGWSTGPIIALTNYAAGLHVINSTHWLVHPQPGNLTAVEAGFETAFGSFTANYSSAGSTSSFTFSTPKGTTGTLVLDIPVCSADIQVRSRSHPGFAWGKRVAGHDGPSPASCGYWGPRTGDDHGAAPNGTLAIDDVPGGDYVVAIHCL
ncbi:hypothetical protein MBLNU459_g5557t1 [Dothideomycetes sp. NU459]